MTSMWTHLKEHKPVYCHLQETTTLQPLYVTDPTSYATASFDHTHGDLFSKNLRKINKIILILS